MSDGHLYVTDLEDSAIRELDLRSKLVTTLVGEDLFVFGDQRGEGGVVRLQHPLGISAWDGLLYPADSYSNKIKPLDARRRAVTTWLGSGVAGRADGRGPAASFREPGGVYAGRQGLYIADSSNHRIAVANWETGEVRKLVAD